MVQGHAYTETRSLYRGLHRRAHDLLLKLRQVLKELDTGLVKIKMISEGNRSAVTQTDSNKRGRSSKQ